MKKTYKQITDFWSEAVQYLSQERDDKLSSAIYKMIGNPLKRRKGILSFVNDEFLEDKNKLFLKYCSVDSQKNIIRDHNKDLVFTVENLEKREAEIKKLLDKEYEFSPEYVLSEFLPDNLDDYQKEVFKGFIIE